MSKTIELKGRVYTYLIKNKMTSGFIDFPVHLKSFLDHAEAGLEGRSSSILMLPGYVPPLCDIDRDESVIVLDAGGTNLRIAVAHFSPDCAPKIESLKKLALPGSEGPITCKEFFNKLAEYIAPFADVSDKIGFCFSFPAEILPDGDARIVSFTKELLIEGSQGALVASELNSALCERGLAEKKIQIVNDTLACMLGGASAHKNRDFADHLGLIVGTGINTCYYENTADIKKISAQNFKPRMAINMESGGFSGFAQGRFDVEFDEASAYPHKQKFEKMVSGAYFGPLVLTVLHGMARDGLISDSVLGLKSLGSPQVDEFLFHPRGVNALAQALPTTDDALSAYFAIDLLYDRAAKAASVVLCGTLIKCGNAADPLRPVGIIVEGSTFLKSKLLRTYIERYLLPECASRNLYFDFIQAEHTTLIGAAAASIIV